MMCHPDFRSLLSGALLLLLALPVHLEGSEFRTFRPIAVPPQQQQAEPVKTVSSAVQKPLQPMSQQKVAEAVNRMITAWNSKQIDGVLGDEFYDRSQLSDAMNTKVPRDAELSLLAIQGVRTLDQITTDSPSGKLLVSTVSITASTQLTYNDPTNGYQRREGVNEYILRIKQKAQ